ncbi:hypothetical protein GF385_03500 [Candidatus Dependentiae bacterium]|nr:hypothetical protein [Candidatus Dependentiae bacterium]
MGGQKEKKVLGDDHRLASYLSSLLHKALHYHDVDGLPQIMLHELGHDHSFALNKATYLVDNPDFNHLLGVAGYSHDECHFHKEDMWNNPHSFINDMKDAKYHNSVRSFLNDSLKRKDINLNDAKEVKELGKHLGIEVPEFFAWTMKHGNHGLLLFERKNDEECHWRKSLLQNVAALLSFCGI